MQVAGKPGNLLNSPLLHSGDRIVMDTSTNRPSVRQRPRFRTQRMVDIRWMLRAASLSGRTASVAVVLWADVTASGQPEVSLTPSRLRQIGVSRESAYAAIERMVEAGLVGADRQRGRAVRLTLLDGKGVPLQVHRTA